MLDIPESVKNLFNHDSIRKNFRAVFDSGRPDITNANIVAESLSFSESISSSDSLTFGAAEASVLQFETVGLPNMLGLWFTAYIEIDATTLPEELQTNREDLSYPVYPLPLGRFVVTECPRNHERMVHRQVVAMSEQQSKDGYTSEAIKKICRWEASSSKPVTLQLPLRGDTALLLSGYDAAADPAYLTTLASQTADILNPRISRLHNIRFDIYTDIDLTDTYTISTDRVEAEYELEDAENSIGAYYATLDFDNSKLIDPEELIAWIVEGINRRGAYAHGTSSPDGWSVKRLTVEEIEARVRERVGSGITTPRSTLYLTGYKTDYFWSAEYTLAGKTAVFPPIFCKETPPPRFRYQYLHSVALTSSAGNVYGWRTLIADPEALARGTISFELKRYAKPAAVRNAFENLMVTVESTATPTEDGSYSLDFDLSEISKTTQSFLELSGSFTKYGRDGTKRAAKLEKVNPVVINRNQYQSCWWNEYDISPIGAIEYNMHETTYTHTIGPGLSVYTIAHAEVFDKTPNLTEEQANEIIDMMIVPNLTGITFTPFELSAIALPYIEAGDYINIVAEDGTVVESFVLERQLTDGGRFIDSMQAGGVTIEEAVTE